jgi:hypothetical protein
MKKVLFGALALTCAASVFAQGTVIFQTRISGTFQTHVYWKDGVTTQLRGQGAADLPVGTTDWSGYTSLQGGNYLAALMSSPSGDPEALKAWASGVASFRTGTSAGSLAGPLTVTLANVAKDATTANFSIFAWDNTSGLYATPDAAWNAWKANAIAGGTSGTFTVASIGGDFNTPPSLVNAVGLTSFNIYNPVPEPSTMALAGLGAAALMIFRRRK